MNRIINVLLRCNSLICVNGNVNQVSANLSPDSTFAIKANIKSLCPKLSRGSILKSQNRVYTKHEYQPGSKMVEY